MTSNSQLLLFILAGFLILSYVSNCNGKNPFVSNSGTLQAANLPSNPDTPEKTEYAKPAQPEEKKKSSCDSPAFDGRWNSANLLPSETSTKSDWSIDAPGDVLDKNFLTPEQLEGVDTQGSSNRNANRDIRAEPVIPKTNVGPWMQSTIVRNDNYQVRKLDII